MAKLSGSSAIYLQIQRYFEIEIASGRFKPGMKIDPIRTLALEFKVNPNTIQKSLQELERDGLIYTDRTNGKFVIEDEAIIRDLSKKLEKDIVYHFVDEAKNLELKLDEILSMIQQEWEKKV